MNKNKTTGEVKMNNISEVLQKASTNLGVVLSTSATAVSYFTLNDIAVLIGILSTLVLAWFNYSRHKQQKIKTCLEIELLKLENIKLQKEIDK